MADGPWYITAQAVRDYLAIKHVSSNGDDEAFHDATDELIAIAIDCVTAATRPIEPRRPKLLENGAQRFRGPKPLRLGLVVKHTQRAEGGLPQLVQVLPETGSDRRAQGLCATCGRPIPSRFTHCAMHK